MTNEPQSRLKDETFGRDLLYAARYYLGGRSGVIAAMIVMGMPALWVGWPWLVVAGVAPILIALAPCAIMCGLGLCAMKSWSPSRSIGTGSCSNSKTGDHTAVSAVGTRMADRPAVPVVAETASQANMSSVDDPTGTQPEDAGLLSGATTKQEKE